MLYCICANKGREFYSKSIFSSLQISTIVKILSIFNIHNCTDFLEMHQFFGNFLVHVLFKSILYWHWYGIYYLMGSQSKLDNLYLFGDFVEYLAFDLFLLWMNRHKFFYLFSKEISHPSPLMLKILKLNYLQISLQHPV